MKTKIKTSKHLILAIIFIVLAVTTLIPSAGASKACPLGYYAHCTFTPYSTIILVGLAGVHSYLYTRGKSDKDNKK